MKRGALAFLAVLWLGVLLWLNSSESQVRFDSRQQHANTVYTNTAVTITAAWTFNTPFTASSPTLLQPIIHGGTYNTPTFAHIVRAASTTTPTTAAATIGDIIITHDRELRSANNTNSNTLFLIGLGAIGGTNDVLKVGADGSSIIALGNLATVLGLAAGQVALANATGLFFNNAAGSTNLRALVIDSSNILVMGNGTSEVNIAPGNKVIKIDGAILDGGGARVLCIDSSSQIVRGASATSCT